MLDYCTKPNKVRGHVHVCWGYRFCNYNDFSIRFWNNFESVGFLVFNFIIAWLSVFKENKLYYRKYHTHFLQRITPIPTENHTCLLQRITHTSYRETHILSTENHTYIHQRIRPTSYRESHLLPKHNNTYILHRITPTTYRE